MNKKIIFGLVLFLVIGSATAISNKDVLVSLVGYEEECIEYRHKPVTTLKKQWLGWSYVGRKWYDCVDWIGCTSIWDEEGIRELYVYEFEETDECIKWMLVRNK